MLDLWQQEAQTAAQPSPEEGRDLPAGFGESFDAAWSSGQLFSSTLAQQNARNAALDGYAGQVKDAGGDVIGEMNRQTTLTPDGLAIEPDRLQVINGVLAGLKAKDPSIGLQPLTEDDLQAKTVAASRAAVQANAAMAGREQTFGSRVGSFLGGAASTAADPLNLAAMVVAPESEAGILGSALVFGGVAGASQLGNEAVNAPFREQVQPGYIESGAPEANIAAAAKSGALFGGGFRALGNLWTRVKTGSWPTSVRDAGNVVESEANIQDSNVLPGVDGEAAHYGAMRSTISQILRGDPVDVTPFVDMNELSRISEEAELRNRSLDLTQQVAGLPEGDLSAGDRLNRLDAVERQIAEAPDAATKRALNERRDQLLVDTNPEALRAAAAPIEQRAAAQTEQAGIAARLQDIASERAQARAKVSLAPGALAPANVGQSFPLPMAMREFRDGPPLSEFQFPSQPAVHSAEDMGSTLASPDRAQVQRADTERAIDAGASQGKPIMIPHGVDADGEPIYRSAASALDEADGYKTASDHIQACATGGMAAE